MLLRLDVNIMKQKGKSSIKLSQSSDGNLSEMDSSPSKSPRKKQDTTKQSKLATVQVRLSNTNSFTTYKNKNEHLTFEHTAVASQFRPEDISDDDEIWMCEIPNSIDTNELIGKTIKLGGTSKSISTSNGSQIECVSDIQKDDDGIVGETVSLVLQQSDSKLSIKNVKANGRITFRHKIDDNPEQHLEIEDNIPYKAGTDFPKNLRIRHPLYGFQYNDFVDLDAKVQEKLLGIRQHKITLKDEPQHNVVKAEQITPKKMKKRKAESNDEDEPIDTKRSKIKEPHAESEDLAWIRKL